MNVRQDITTENSISEPQTGIDFLRLELDERLFTIQDMVKNISAQHKVLKRPIITETLIETEIYFADVSSLVLRHLQNEEYIQVFGIYANY